MANDILLQKFKNTKLAELTGGYTNSTLLLEGSDPLVIQVFLQNFIITSKMMNCY